MDEYFALDELLYRAVYPPEIASMFWRKNGKVSSAAFADPKGLSVDRGYFRDEKDVIDSMTRRFTGSIITIFAGDCASIQAIIRYLPSKSNIFHSEIHGSEHKPLLSKPQRFYLSERAWQVFPSVDQCLTVTPEYE